MFHHVRCLLYLLYQHDIKVQLYGLLSIITYLSQGSSQTQLSNYLPIFWSVITIAKHYHPLERNVQRTFSHETSLVQQLKKPHLTQQSLLTFTKLKLIIMLKDQKYEMLQTVMYLAAYQTSDDMMILLQPYKLLYDIHIIFMYQLNTTTSSQYIFDITQG